MTPPLAELLRKPPLAIVFDIDGVLIDSLPAKGAAFQQLFAGLSPTQLTQIGELHREHGGVSRFAKIEMIARDIVGRAVTPGERDELAEKFSQLVTNQVIAAPLVDGAQELLEGLTGRIPLYAASATPAAELEYILSARKLRHFFTRVFGHPVPKAEAILATASQEVIARDAILFVGDAKADEAAARTAGSRFVGRVVEGEESPFSPDVPTVSSCRELVVALCGRPA